MTVRLLVGDVRERIREIPDGSVDLLACSPPFLALRKYGDNAAEMGSERMPADFLDALLDLTQEFRRVLAPHGSIAIELGDTYSGSGSASGDYNEGGLRDGQAKFRQDFVGDRNRKMDDRKRTFRTQPRDGHTGGGNGWPLAKSLTLIPTLYPASLAYGWNMLNPAHTFDRWRVRNVIVWARPNPPVGALGDKVRPATSYITIACTSAKRWFDLDGVRTQAQGQPDKPNGPKGVARAGVIDHDGAARLAYRIDSNGGAPPLDWWEDDDPTGHATLVLPTQPYPGAHYATWPEKLAARLIEMMCPLRVCTTCGEPSRRIVGEATYSDKNGKPVPAHIWQSGVADGRGAHAGKTQDPSGTTRSAPTIGWTDCDCDCPKHKFDCVSLCNHKWRPGMILDPFCGSGTTLAVAQGLARDATGIELYEANADLCRDRIGMFLEIA